MEMLSDPIPDYFEYESSTVEVGDVAAVILGGPSMGNHGVCG